jgi:hypothetical protein
VRPRRDIPLALAAAVLVRIPFWLEALRTPLDGDSSIIGLMARHLGRGTSMWGQPYGSPLDAWIAAPFVALLGTTVEAVRVPYFLCGLALIPLAYFLAGALHPRAAFPAAVVMACPPPYFLLLSALPPPFYPTTLVLCGGLLLWAIRLAWSEGRPRWLALCGWGALAGLALWTHLMSASAVAAGLACLVWRRAPRIRVALAVVVPLLATSAPWWLRALSPAEQAMRAVSLSGREEGFVDHLAEVLPQMHRPVLGLLGAHVPMIPDEGSHLVAAPVWVAALLAVVYLGALVLSAKGARVSSPETMLLGAAALALIAFPLPIRSGPNTIRFLTPAYLPLLAVIVARLARAGPRRAWLVVLVLANLHLVGGARLLAAWRVADRAEAPFLLPDLAPAQELLIARGVRRAYASYGPAYRLTYESGERIVASQPWNERFRHYPLPFLDEVRFWRGVAWVLTPTVPTDLPHPKLFERALRDIGGGFVRDEAGAAVVFHGFVPPFAPEGTSPPGAGAAGDGDPFTALAPAREEPTTIRLEQPTALDALSLLGGVSDVRLLRSMDLQVSGDGVAFETVASRRRRQEREDLRWVGGHPQYVIDHDLISVPLRGRVVAALRIVPVLSTDPWTLSEVVLHPTGAGRKGPWDEWLAPELSWPKRREALAASPRPNREDWLYRSLLAARAR